MPYALPPRATFDEAAALAAALPAAVGEAASSGGAFEIDASALTAYDSATIALLLQARRVAREAGRDVVVHGTPAQLVELARLYGVDSLLSLDSAPAAAA